MIHMRLRTLANTDNESWGVDVDVHGSLGFTETFFSSGFLSSIAFGSG